MSETPFRLDNEPRRPAAAKPARGLASLTLTINGTAYALWKVPAKAEAAHACFELKKKGQDERYYVSEHAHGCECTCGDFTFRRNHLDPDGCKHIKALAIFGMVENHPAPDRGGAREDRPFAPAPAPDHRPADARPRLHPLEAAGVGKAPFQVAAVIRLAPAARARTDAAVAARRGRQVESAARLFRVDPTRCAACRRPGDTLYLLETAERVNAPVCLDCLLASDDRGLRRKAAHLDHERDRLDEQHARDRDRQLCR